jgi:hypothetical protein
MLLKDLGSLGNFVSLLFNLIGSCSEGRSHPPLNFTDEQIVRSGDFADGLLQLTYENLNFFLTYLTSIEEGINTNIEGAGQLIEE